MSWPLMGALLFPLAFCPVPIDGQTVAAAEPETVVSALRSAGYRAEVTTDSHGDPMIRSASGGTNWSLYFYGCRDNRDCRSVQFAVSFDKAEALDADNMNDWNRRIRFGQASVDDEGDPRLSLDLNLAEGGISRALFIDNVELWDRTLSRFLDHIDWGAR
ncbi:MAG: YbjN domain-containing protein [Longimicrobiales bacterium]